MSLQINRAVIIGLLGIVSLVGAKQNASATAILDVTEITSYTQIYQIDIPDDANYNVTGQLTPSSQKFQSVPYRLPNLNRRQPNVRGTFPPRAVRAEA